MNKKEEKQNDLKQPEPKLWQLLPTYFPQIETYILRKRQLGGRLRSKGVK
jgi:hypothetical protein